MCNAKSITDGLPTALVPCIPCGYVFEYVYAKKNSDVHDLDTASGAPKSTEVCLPVSLGLCSATLERVIAVPRGLGIRLG